MTHEHHHDEAADYPTLLTLEDLVPDVNLEIYDPQKDLILDHKLSDNDGKWTILFFYPADFTFVCPTELKDLNKIYEDIVAQNAEIFVVSVDTVFSHKRWVETEALLKGFGIKMVADRTTELATMFGVLNPETGNAERATIIISPESVIKSIEMVTEPLGRSSAELLRKLKALEFMRTNPGSACPASWNDGDEVLHPSIELAGHVGEHLG
ncbi:MAG: peroxiredoxin [bacterium]|nr:peroxiredoxin [bacterium]